MSDRHCCPFCQTAVAVPASLAGRQVKCPHCGSEFPAPESPPPAAAAPDHGSRPQRATRFTFTCQRCGSALEAGSDLSGTLGRCPTCAAVFRVPQVDPYTGLPTGPALVADDGQLPTPMHAYAAAGDKAPQIKRLASGDQVIVCPRCAMQVSVDADICARCGMPFTMDGAASIAAGTAYASNGMATTSFVLGVLALPTFCFPVLGILAIGTGLTALLRPPAGADPAAGRRHAFAGIVCGAASVGLGALMHWRII